MVEWQGEIDGIVLIDTAQAEERHAHYSLDVTDPSSFWKSYIKEDKSICC